MQMRPWRQNNGMWKSESVLGKKKHEYKNNSNITQQKMFFVPSRILFSVSTIVK